MLNEEKARYMTQLAVFERRAGKKIFPIDHYFKKGYVGGQMFRSFLGYTFCYLLFLLMWVLYKLDELLNEMSIDEILDAVKKWDVIYVAGLVLYLTVTWIVYSKRYGYTARSQTIYTSKLKHLVGRYEKERPERKRGNREGKTR